MSTLPKLPETYVLHDYLDKNACLYVTIPALVDTRSAHWGCVVCAWWDGKKLFYGRRKNDSSFPNDIRCSLNEAKRLLPLLANLGEL